MSFKIKIDTDAHADIQEGIHWYNKQKPGLGHKFHAEVKATLGKLKTNPFFQIRYDGVHCLPLKKFPYMVHFTIDDEKMLVIIQAVFHTTRSTKTWEKRK